MNNVSNYSSFLRRFAAYIIDSIIISIPFYIWIAVSAASMLKNAESTDSEAASEAMNDSLGGFMMAYLVMFVLYILYNAYFESSESGATLGKKAMKIRVADANGNRISFGKALLRSIGKIFSALILAIGFIMAAFTQHKQALHDIIAGTYVYNNKTDINLSKDM